MSHGVYSRINNKALYFHNRSSRGKIFLSRFECRIVLCGVPISFAQKFITVTVEEEPGQKVGSLMVASKLYMN
jgi:hypothetical protein